MADEKIVQYLHEQGTTVVERLDWNKISKDTLSEEFIDTYAKYLNWTVLSSEQPLSPYLVQKYLNRVDWFGMSYNKNLPIETIVAFIDSMDLELSQVHHTYTDEFVTDHFDVLNPKLLLTFQKGLSAKTIEQLVVWTDYDGPGEARAQSAEDAMATPYPSEDLRNARTTSQLRAGLARPNGHGMLANVAIVHQKVPVEMLSMLMNYEQCGAEKLVLFDRVLVLKYQTHLPVEWVVKNIVGGEKSRVLLLIEYFTLPELMIFKYMLEVDPDIMKALMTHQSVREPALKYCLETSPARTQLDGATMGVRDERIELIVWNQQISDAFINTYIIDYYTKLEYFEQLNTMMNILLMRCATGDLNLPVAYMQSVFTPKFEHVYTLDIGVMESYVNEVIQYIQKNNFSHIDIDRMELLENCDISKETYELMHYNRHILYPTDWVTSHILKSRNIITAEDMQKYFDSNWWDVDGMIMNPSYDKYLNYFVEHNNWSEFLRTEITLSQTFIESMEPYTTQIEAAMNGISFWWKISRYQTHLCEAFIRSNLFKFDIKMLLQYQTLSTELVNELKPFMDTACLQIADELAPTPISANDNVEIKPVNNMTVHIGAGFMNF